MLSWDRTGSGFMVKAQGNGVWREYDRASHAWSEWSYPDDFSLSDYDVYSKVTKEEEEEVRYTVYLSHKKLSDALRRGFTCSPPL